MNILEFSADHQPRQHIAARSVLHSYSVRLYLLQHLYASASILTAIMMTLLTATLLLGEGFRFQVLSTLGLPQGWDMGLPTLLSCLIVALFSLAMLSKRHSATLRGRITEFLEQELSRIRTTYPLDEPTRWQLQAVLRGTDYENDPAAQLARLHDIERQFIPSVIY